MKKRRFRIKGGKYGGELTIGKISLEFYNYWKERDEYDLINFILSQQDFSESPQLNGEWYEVDDIEHIFGCYGGRDLFKNRSADSIFRVFEIPIDGSDNNRFDSDCLNIKPGHLYYREAYHHNNVAEDSTYFNNPDRYDENDYSPILIVHTEEKGDFGSWFVETDENGFNPKNLFVSTVETNFGVIIENVWYGKEKLKNDGMRSTDGQSTRAEVGSFGIALHKEQSCKELYTDKYLETYWLELPESENFGELLS